MKFSEEGFHRIVFTSIDNEGNSKKIEYPDKLLITLPYLISIIEINENTIIQTMVLDFYNYPKVENKTLINFYDDSLVNIPEFYINGIRCYECVNRSGEIEYTYNFKLEKGHNEIMIKTQRYSNQLWYSENRDFNIFGLRISKFPFKYFNAVYRLNVGIPPLELLNIQGYKQRKIIVKPNIPYEFDLKFSGLKKLYIKESISPINETTSLKCTKEESDFIQRFSKIDNQYIIIMDDYEEFSDINYYVESRLKPMFRYQVFFI